MKFALGSLNNQNNCSEKTLSSIHSLWFDHHCPFLKIADSRPTSNQHYHHTVLIKFDDSCIFV